MADLKLLIIESDEFLRQSIRTQVESLDGVTLVGESADPAAAHRMVAQHPTDVVLLELPDHPDEALGFAEWLRVEQPDTMVIGAARNVRPELMRKAMRCGALDFLPRPVDPGQLKVAIDHVLELRARRQRSLVPRGQVTAVMGVGGGIGTTTIATNMAVALAQRDEGAVVLADFDLMMGNVPCFLDLAASRTYVDLLAGMEKLDAEGLRQTIPRHASGLYMLAGPQRIEDLDAVTPGDVGRIVDLCRSSFRQVIVDAGHGFDERRIEVLDRSDRILLVVQLNVAALHSARRAAEALNQLGYPDDQIKVIANRFNRSAEVGLEAAEKGLGRPVTFRVPNDYRTVVAAIDSGVPLVAGKRSSRVAKGIRALIAELVAPENGDGDLLAAATPAAAAAGPDVSGGRREGHARRPGPLGRLFARWTSRAPQISTA